MYIKYQGDGQMLTICLQHHQGGPKCAYIDCEKQHPGCSDEEGNMYKHGDKFVPKSSCDTCTCNNGRPDHCTSCAYYAMGVPRHCPDKDHCNKEHPGCLDKNGKMHKHGAKFVPTSQDPCKVCICKDGKHHECRPCIIGECPGLYGPYMGLTLEQRNDLRACRRMEPLSTDGFAASDNDSSH